jgi:hypothetical protein
VTSPIALDLTRLFIGPITPMPRGIDQPNWSNHARNSIEEHVIRLQGMRARACAKNTASGICRGRGPTTEISESGKK